MPSQTARTPPRTFGELLLNSFWASHGPILAFLGVVLTIITIIWVPKDVNLSLRVIIFPAALAAYLIIWLAHAAWSAFRSRSIVLPLAVGARSSPSVFPDSIALLLIQPSELFSHDSIVCIYYLEEEFERPIGIGRVFNIQDDGIIQVLVMRDLGYGEEWQTILQNDTRVLRRLKIKPNVPFSVVEI